MKTLTIGLLLVLTCGLAATAEDEPSRQPQKLELVLVRIAESTEPEYIFVVGSSGFKSVAGLKEFLSHFEPGSELVWNPGCIRLGGEPLLDSERELAEFRAYVESLGIKFTLVKAG